MTFPTESLPFWSCTEQLVEGFQSSPITQAVETTAAKTAATITEQWIVSQVGGTPFNTQASVITAINSLNSVIPGMTTAQGATLIASSVTNALPAPVASLKFGLTRGAAAPQTLGQALADAYPKADPKTPAQRLAVLNALVKGVSEGTAKAALKKGQ